MTYSDLGEPYGCTEDCSGHEAGAAWAADNDLRDPGDCGGRSQSFLEGCQAYTETSKRWPTRSSSGAIRDSRKGQSITHLALRLL